MTTKVKSKENNCYYQTFIYLSSTDNNHSHMLLMYSTDGAGGTSETSLLPRRHVSQGLAKSAFSIPFPFFLFLNNRVLPSLHWHQLKNRTWHCGPFSFSWNSVFFWFTCRCIVFVLLIICQGFPWCSISEFIFFSYNVSVPILTSQNVH